jgi:hypothetical protein
MSRLLKEHGPKTLRVVFGVALAMVIYAIVKSGLPRYLLVEVILKSPLVKWLLLMLFNFKMGGTKAVKN